MPDTNPSIKLEIVSLLMEKKWNHDEQKIEHTWWLRNEGEYGKHLDRRLALVIPKIKIATIINFMRTKMLENGYRPDQLINKINIGSVDDALTVFQDLYSKSKGPVLCVLENIKKAQANQAVVKKPVSSLRR